MKQAYFRKYACKYLIFDSLDLHFYDIPILQFMYRFHKIYFF